MSLNAFQQNGLRQGTATPAKGKKCRFASFDGRVFCEQQTIQSILMLLKVISARTNNQKRMPARRYKHTHNSNGMGRKPSHRQCKKYQPTRNGYNKKPNQTWIDNYAKHSGKCSEMMSCQRRYELHAFIGTLQIPARKTLQSRETENWSPELPTITAISAAIHNIHTGSVRASNFYRAFSTSKNLVGWRRFYVMYVAISIELWVAHYAKS